MTTYIKIATSTQSDPGAYAVPVGVDFDPVRFCNAACQDFPGHATLLQEDIDAAERTIDFLQRDGITTVYLTPYLVVA